jgi:HK97 family phage major capsid protein
MNKLTELRDKRNKLMKDAHDILHKDNVTAEDRSSFDAMMADVDIVEGDITREERLEKFATESRSFTPPPRGVPGEGAGAGEERSAKEKEAFEQYLRVGVADMDPELRGFLKRGTVAERRTGLTTGTTSGVGGGSVVPTGFYDVLTQAKKAYGTILQEVSNIKTANGENLQVPFSNDTGNGLTTIAQNASTGTEVDPSLASATLGTDIVSTTPVLVSFALLQDAAFDINQFIRDAFGLRYARGLTNFVTSGNTSNVAALVSTTGSSTVATASGTVCAYTDLVKLFAALDPAYLPNGKFAMNASTRGTLMGVVDTLGRPIYIPAPSADAFDRLFGKEVVLNQSLGNIPTTTGSTIVPIQFGDFKQGYLLREVVDGLTILRLNERYADTLQVGFIGYARVGGILTDAGTHPIMNLTMIG